MRLGSARTEYTCVSFINGFAVYSEVWGLERAYRYPSNFHRWAAVQEGLFRCRLHLEQFRLLLLLHRQMEFLRRQLKLRVPDG